MIAALALAALAPAAPVATDQLGPVRVAPGRRINLVCTGRGRPTVVFTPGAGATAAAWRVVQAVVATRTRTCAWDRAGFGRSDASAARQTATETTADLTRALAAGGIAGRLVLVGHSIGAYETLLFADRNRARVVGMVLVEPSLPDMFRRAGTDPTQVIAATAAPFRACAAALAARPGGRSAACPPGADAARYRTIESFLGAVGESARAAANPRRSYGAMPLMVLTAGARPPQPTPRAMGHAELAKLSTRSVQGFVPNSGHMMHRDAPQAIVAAIDVVLDQVARR